MDALIDQIKLVAASADQAELKRLVDVVNDLQLSVESPNDTIQRIAHLSLQPSVIRVGIQLNLFKILSDSKDSLYFLDISKKTGAAPALQVRILRYLSSIGIIKETGKDLFAASAVTKALADPGYAAGICHNFDTNGPCYQNLPSFLAKTNYQNITSATATVFQDAFHTDVPRSIWFQQNPQNFAYFDQWTSKQCSYMPDWLESFPVEQECSQWKSAGADGVVFVDIDHEGLGKQCMALKHKYPNIPGRVVLQVHPEILEQVPAIPGVEVMPHNFWEPQPVKGAKFYYLRNILRDYPCPKCIEILQKLVPAMNQDSRILIDEMFLSETNVYWQATQLDLTRMLAVGSMERTKEQWTILLDAAGLKILDVFMYTDLLQNSVIMAAPK